MNTRFSLSAILVCCGLLLLGAGQSQSNEPTTDAMGQAVSEIMNSPMDGSSVEAFEKDLERVREEAGNAEYMRLDSAIKYLLFYDLSVRKDRAKLYSKLNGKTPSEIVAMTGR